MEIPQDLKNLYKHWNFHTTVVPEKTRSEILDNDLLRDIVNFASERMRVWEKKTSNSIQPFTQDSILRDFRFCNIYRELDRQTIQIHKLLKPLENDFELWLLNLAFNRFLCKPETFEKVGFLNFEEKNNLKVVQNLLELSSPKYGSAYVFPISVIQRSEFDTREKFFTMYLPKIIPRIAKELKQTKSSGVKETLDEILPVFGFKFKFHWTEILIDVAYQFPSIINLYKKFPLGPGSIPTIKRLSTLHPEETLLELIQLEFQDFPYLEYEGKRVCLSAENWEGIGCEFRKYTNLLNKTGRRRLYNSR